MQKPDDPVTPHVTFDSYVIPQSVQRKTQVQTPVMPQVRSMAPPPRLGMSVSGMVLAIGSIAVLSFVLGVMGTLKFVRPSQPAMVAQVQEVQSDVTRQQGLDLISTIAPAAPATTQAAAFLLQDGMAEARTSARAMLAPETEQMLRSAVLTGDYAIAKQGADGPRRLVLSDADAEEARQALGAKLRAAIADGAVEVPGYLKTATGGSDVDMVLFDLIQSSLIADGSAEAVKAARDMNRRVFAASDARTEIAEGVRRYVVRADDSLAYLALQFYGHPNQHHLITVANETLLRSADGIRTGQQLIIPE